MSFRFRFARGLAAALVATSAGAQAADPFIAAQSAVDWLVPAVCSWMQSPANQEVDCTTGQVETCLGCHVQGEATFALSRASSRCYATPATACALPGDESLFEFTTRF